MKTENKPSKEVEYPNGMLVVGTYEKHKEATRLKRLKLTKYEVDLSV